MAWRAEMGRLADRVVAVAPTVGKVVPMVALVAAAPVEAVAG